MIEATIARWLPRSFWGILPIKVHSEPDQVCFYLWGFSTPLLQLTRYHYASGEDRQVLFVTGGSLARTETTGRLEFRQVLDEQTLLVGLVDFEPTLPWWLYRITQAIAHRLVMGKFKRHLAQKT